MKTQKKKTGCSSPSQSCCFHQENSSTTLSRWRRDKGQTSACLLPCHKVLKPPKSMNYKVQVSTHVLLNTFDDVSERHQRFVDIFCLLETVTARFRLLSAFTSGQVDQTDATHFRRLRCNVVLGEMNADDGVGSTAKQ